MHVCTHVCVEARSYHWVFSSVDLHISFLKQGLLLNSEFTDRATEPKCLPVSASASPVLGLQIRTIALVYVHVLMYRAELRSLLVRQALYKLCRPIFNS